MKKIETSIILVTLNAGVGFKEILRAIFKQTYKNFEVILIDSSSTDKTLIYAKEYPIKIHKIKRSEFGHGKTRNLGARLAKGQLIVYLTQDAIPYNKYWLERLIANFKDKQVAAVFGKQIPLKSSPPPDKYSYSRDYPDRKFTITIKNYLNLNVIFSNVSSAIRKELLISHPFKKNIIVSEDIYWANKIIRLGYKVNYEPKSQVIHSHKYTLKKIFEVNYLQGRGYELIYRSNNFVLKNSSTRFIDKMKFLFISKDFVWILYSFVVDGVRFIAFTLGRRRERRNLYE